MEGDKKRILSNERNFSQEVLDTAQAIILRLDTKGRIVYFNPYMEKISGYKLKEMKGKDWFSNFLPKEDWPRIKKLFLKAVGDIQTKGNINPVMTKKGEKIYIEVSESKNHVYFELTNYGTKIVEDEIEKIWLPFYRLEQGTDVKLKTKGSGIGLYLVSEILKAHEADFGIKNIKNGVKAYFKMRKRVL